MAKKKSKKNNIKPILKLVALVLGVGAVLLGLLKCVAITGQLVDVKYSGFEVMFGYSRELVEGVPSTNTEYLKFSFMALLAFLLPLLGGALILPKNKIINFVSIGCFVVGAILLFLLPTFVVTEYSIYLASTIKMSLAVGAILAAICSILGGLVTAYITFTK